MKQSGKFAFFPLLIGIMLSMSVVSCSTNQTNSSAIALEIAAQNNSDTMIATNTPIPSGSDSANTAGMPAMKAEIQPTFNATLHVDRRAEPHLLAILGSYNESIDNESVLSFAADGKSFVMQNGAQLSIWRSSPLKEIRAIPLPTDGVIQKIALSEDNHYAAAILLDPQTNHATLMVWKVMSGETVIIMDLGSAAASDVHSNKKMPVWDLYDLAFVPRTGNLIWKNGKTIHFLETESGSEPSPISLREDMTAQKITFTRDGRFLYVLLYALSYDNQPIYQIQIWDTRTLKWRKSVSLEDLYTKTEVDLQASYVLIRNAEEMSLQKMSMENEEVEGLPYRLGSFRISADGLFMVFQHIPDGSTNRQYDIEFWSAYNWRQLYVLDNDGEGVNIDYPMDLYSPNEIIFNRDHTLMGICNNGKAYLYDIDDMFSIK